MIAQTGSSKLNSNYSAFECKYKRHLFTVIGRVMRLTDKKLRTIHECEYCQMQVWELSDLNKIHKCSVCGDKTDFDDPDIQGEWYCHSCGNGIITDMDGSLVEEWQFEWR